MPTLPWKQIQSNAIAFSKKWKDAWNEEAQAQAFELDFFRVFGVEDALAVGSFEHKVKTPDGNNGYIDYFWPGQIAVEMKSRGEDLPKAYGQLFKYVESLPKEHATDLLMVCDFEKIILYRHSTFEKTEFKTKDLHKNVKRFASIAGYSTARIHENQVEVNVKAAEKMAKLHDALKSHGYDGHELEVYLVRLLFCLFADDTGIFPKDSFVNYVEESKADGSNLSDHIQWLFEVLNMPPEQRAKRDMLSEELKQFAYINGGLFRDRLSPAAFDAKMRTTLLDCCEFSWATISPAVFGAMFQGVMDHDQRRELGAHYTSEENILKLINPLFMDELWAEFERVKTVPAQLERFHEKISHLKFLDPACGCGNFLIITYRELRKLELELLKMRVDEGNLTFDLDRYFKVNVEQFFGIEYEDFPCQIAQVGMWLMDHQMNMRVAEEFGQYYARLPLTQSATIVHGNALRIDWQSIVPNYELSFILGNPPFVGARVMGDSQKSDILSVFGDLKGVGNLDYVAAWYKKAAEIMRGTAIRSAFVSTNSITQGEQVSLLWRPLFDKLNIHIDFGYRTFKWSNDAKGKAAVHCVIIGFSSAPNERAKVIYTGAGEEIQSSNINPYLVDAPNIFINSRNTPICDAPEIGIGNKPIDGGFYLFTEDEKAEFLRLEPKAEKWFRPWIGADEFINGYFRYCLWLGDCPPSELRTMPQALKRVNSVRQFRLDSKSAPTQKLAEIPTRFHVENMPKSMYIVIPEVSSERRKYIPMGFLSPDIMCSNKLRLLPGGTLYHFGVLTSNVHMAWTRAVSGRLKSDFQYSVNIVYNNFPWPDATQEQIAAIEKAAQAVLDARAQFSDSSLADLYDPLTMPPALLKAHQNLDRAVMAAYGFPVHGTTETSCAAALMERYRVLAERADM